MNRLAAVLLVLAALLTGCGTPKSYPVPFQHICGANPIDTFYAAGGDRDELLAALDAYERCITQVYEARSGESVELLLKRMYPDGF